MRLNYQLHAVAGNLTRDVESAEQYANFTLALDTGFGDKKAVHFMNMKAFPKTFKEGAWKLLTSLKKGTNVLVEYTESDGSYTNKDGVKVRDIQRVISKFQPIFNDKPKTEEGAEGEEAAATPAPKASGKPATPKVTPAPAPADDDQIPF